MLTQKLRIKETKQNYAFLRWCHNSHTEQREINSFISLGRDKDNVIILDDDESISRRHFRIQKKDNEGFILQDMNSKNGTFLNGNRIIKAILKNNDRIQAGTKDFTFSFERFDNYSNIHTKSKNNNWSQQLSTLPNIAKSNMPVLITGPSGTGKEMLAKLIHRYSYRTKEPMVSINCSALSESLIESEFFGHVKGSYTGALTSRKGAFMAAHRGSLFLDEIGDLPLQLQPKLLRALEYQEVKAVGSDYVTKTDVRIIAATHQDLAKKVAQKTFRSDLYFRLHVLNLSLPSLKNRMEDFDDLLNFFCHEYNISFSQKAVQCLKKNSWPGNIRELKNTVARAKALFSGTVVDADKIPQIIYTQPSPLETQTTNAEDLKLPVIKKIEKDLIIKSMTLHQGHQNKVAKELGLPPSTLSERIKKYGINPKEYKTS